MNQTIILYSLIFIYGIVVGSFLNVCIYRIPKQESLVSSRSHCMNCGYQLRWYDLIPVFSYLFLGGRCRQCKKEISIQYPLVELLNGSLWVLTFFFCGIGIHSVIYCFMISALIVLSIIDARTFEIPIGINIFLLIIGSIREVIDGSTLYQYVFDLCIVGGFLFLLFVITDGRGIGGGDVKLMGVAGLLLGWKLVLVALIFGCLYGSVIHIARMKLSKVDHVLAMGPYLSAGIITAAWFGERMIAWYTAGWFV